MSNDDMSLGLNSSLSGRSSLGPSEGDAKNFSAAQSQRDKLVASMTSNISNNATFVSSFADGDGRDEQNPAHKAFCALKSRQYPSLTPQLLSATPPFTDPVARDYKQSRKNYVMREVDTMVLKDRLFALKKISGLLKQHKIPYWLEAGTLLGAYRHRAFIPWDDDIDLTMPIGFQSKLLAVVKPAAAKFGIVIHQLWFPPGNPYYSAVGTYIRRYAPRVANTVAGNATYGTLGYFCQAWYKGTKLDLWQAFPVILDNQVLYANGVSGSTLFSRRDVFPLGQVVFEGRKYPAPARAHRYLAGIYKTGLATPAMWRSWYDPHTCTWNPVKVESQKQPRSEASKYFSTMVYDNVGDPHLDVPQSLIGEVDSPQTFSKMSPLGNKDSVISPLPSGHGYPPQSLR